MDPVGEGSQIDQYRVEILLGEGGMAQVYKAWNTGLHRHEALKILPPAMTFDKSFTERFLNEARTAAGLRHPNIATIHTVGSDTQTQPYFAMEMVEGGSLADVLRERPMLPLAEATAILRQIASALDYAHARGVIHRDVKPANILLDKTPAGQWTVKVVDFGIARAQEGGDGARLTRTGMIIGTPEYMSPEQAGNGIVVSSRSDLYSLGIVAYEMLCGRPPFQLSQGDSLMTVIVHHLRDAPPSPRTIAPNLPPYVDGALMQALAKDPADRFPTCSGFVDALAGPLEATAPLPFEPQAKATRPPRRAPAWAAVAALALIGCALVGYAVLHPRKPEPPAVVDQTSTVHETPATSPAPPSTPAPAPVDNASPAVVPVTQAPSADAGSQSSSGQGGDTGGTGESWREYRNDQLGFSISYPATWRQTQRSIDATTYRVAFISPVDNVTTSVDVTPASGRSAAADWEDLDSRFQRKYGGNYQRLSLVDSTLDGEQASEWNFTLFKSGQNLEKLDLGASHLGRGYAVLCIAPSDQFARWQDIFEKTKSSLRWTEH